MNRIELVEKLAAEHDLSKAGAARILDTVFSSIIAAVKKGDTASFVGFGTFRQAKRAARTGFNPRTGEPVKIAAMKVPKFVPGASFKAAVDPKRAERKAAGAKAGAKKAAAKKPAARKAARKA
jgi:DNA-binding protein HU-beta